MRVLNIVSLAPFLLEMAFAVPWIEPLPTPQSQALFDAGVSPRPTEAPGLNGVPKELMRRQQNVIYPPPPGWCGFITGDYSDPLTCRPPYTCVISGYGVGCCPNTLPGCTNIYTSCKDFGDFCDSTCVSNEKIRKCSDSSMPYCGTFRFSAGTRLYNCDSTSGFASSVQFLADYYITAIGSTLPPQADFLYSTTSSTGSRSTSTYTPSSPYKSDATGGLSAEAIRGIAIGVSIGVCVIFIAIAFFIVKKRRANRMKRAAQPGLPPAYSPSAPMQQQQPPTNPTAYQPVPQQDQSYPPTKTGYFAPDVAGKSNGTTVTSQPALSPPANQTPPAAQTTQQRHSAAPSSFLSPDPIDHGKDSVYRSNGPMSPTITEVDGSERPLPEADSIQRPNSTHQGTVSPVQTGSTASSPPPPHFMQQYGNPQQQQHMQGQSHGQQQQGQGQSKNGYVAPKAGTHEAPPTQAYAGPYEMPDQRP
ncbi:MAG: hypothetical protein Q9166_008224 [cf. Caloplaca sp. 2 TL-2023]